MRPLGFVLPVAPGTFPAQASGGSSSEETSGAIASRRGVARAQRGWPALSPVGTAVPESQDRWAPHYRGTGSQVLASGRVIVVCHTSPSKTLLTRPAREPHIVGFTTTSTYQEAREPEKWKATLTDLVSDRLVINDGRTF